MRTSLEETFAAIREQNSEVLEGKENVIRERTHGEDDEDDGCDDDGDGDKKKRFKMSSKRGGGQSNNKSSPKGKNIGD
ncbi:hypothetical protein L2E82_31253 [Cichorium intybus]|uniref:Uncharacterized protein n=1 Tax=Cichorium intybus TaxID=13427 RepID=A0ACB9D2H9_CICIN|nr:hypothetical protein L2E82_31253 [Cichorium intybus]